MAKNKSGLKFWISFIISISSSRIGISDFLYNNFTSLFLIFFSKFSAPELTKDFFPHKTKIFLKLLSLTNFKTNEIYNISDDKPASSQEVMSYAAKILKTDLPKTIDEQDIKSEMLKNFYKDSKKVSNKKMKKFFSYNLKFPTYIEGLNTISNNLT